MSQDRALALGSNPKKAAQNPPCLIRRRVFVPVPPGSVPFERVTNSVPVTCSLASIVSTIATQAAPCRTPQISTRFASLAHHSCRRLWAILARNQARLKLLEASQVKTEFRDCSFLSDVITSWIDAVARMLLAVRVVICSNSKLRRHTPFTNAVKPHYSGDLCFTA